MAEDQVTDTRNGAITDAEALKVLTRLKKESTWIKVGLVFCIIMVLGLALMSATKKK